MQRRNQPRRLTSEPLEERRVMDGTVNVVLSGNTLKITGDDLSNVLRVRMDGANLRIEGGDTNVTFNGNTAATQVIGGLDFNKLDLKFDLKGGNDRLFFGDNKQQLIAKSLSVDTGAGVDVVVLASVAIVGKTDVKTFKSAGENDRDFVTFAGVSSFLGDCRIRTGGGDDSLRMGESQNTTIFGKRLAIDVGAGDDRVLMAHYVCSESFALDLGAGDDQLQCFNGSVRKTFDVKGGKGSDFSFIGNGGSYNKLAVNLGDGNDAVVAAQVTVADFRVNAGKGDDEVTGNALNTTKFSQFDGGAGNDTFNFTASNSNIPAAGKLPKNFEVQNIT